MNHRRSPTHDETAADAVDAAAEARPTRSHVARRVVRGFWWVAHHAIARPLATAFPVRRMFRFSAWTHGRRNM